MPSHEQDSVDCIRWRTPIQSLYFTSEFLPLCHIIRVASCSAVRPAYEAKVCGCLWFKHQYISGQLTAFLVLDLLRMFQMV